MKGNNTMELNQASMIEAVQVWMDQQSREGKVPVVRSVNVVKDTQYQRFEVNLEEPPPVDANAQGCTGGLIGVTKQS